MSRTRILVVDDDAITRELLREMLERTGHEVREAADGRAGLRELYAATPELVILDVSMPELDGWATIERIRDLSDVPVLMLTAHEGELERVRGLEFKLLAAFVRHPNQVLSRDQLLELVWGDSLGVSPEQVKLYVGYLRHKLDPAAPESTPIETVRGFGYRYRRPS
jgi:DNA-binding response OmpR family regulator